MSRPGDPGRRTEWVEGGVQAIVVKVVELVHSVPGAHSFELKYEAMDRVLADDEQPGPDDTVLWTATAKVRRRHYPGAPKVTREYVGTATVAPGGAHMVGIVHACAALLEEMGANVVLLTDMWKSGDRP